MVMIFSMLMAKTVHAQFAPPTILPSENIALGGRCIGLADKIRTGDISLYHIPCFIKYFTQTLVAIAGTISVIFIMIGGYKWTIESVDKKEEAKNTIKFAIIGLIVSLSAWFLIDIVLQLATE